MSYAACHIGLFESFRRLDLSKTYPTVKPCYRSVVACLGRKVLAALFGLCHESPRGEAIITAGMARGGAAGICLMGV